MKPTTEILERVYQNSQANPNEEFIRLFRYMLRPDIYFIAYKNLYANNGASTPGVDESDTADGFSEERINKIIEALRNNTYYPKPVRRVYINKRNGKKRPLGLPTFTDKLVQEVLRMILEAVYEPIFAEQSHGFRPNRSCHTALKTISKEFGGIRWFIEGDIRGCFDNIDHHVLIAKVRDKIKDARIIQLLWKFLKAGYLEEWQYNATYSGTPQGGIISPLLANIYLHEFDKFMMKLKEDFDKPAEQKFTKEYQLAQNRVKNLRQKIKRTQTEDKSLVEEWKKARYEMLQIPSKAQTNKVIKYIRYADDFLIRVNGSREDCQEIKQQITEFMANELHMELSEEKTLITHSSEKARFLGYDVCVRRNSEIRKVGKLGLSRRTLNNRVALTIPMKDKIVPFMRQKGIIRQNDIGEILPTARKELIGLTPLEIIQTYNSELRGICNYYSIAGNFRELNQLAYLMEQSCLKTLAAKFQTTIRQIANKYRAEQGKWAIPYETQRGEKLMYFVNYQDCKKKATERVDEISNQSIMFRYSRSTFEEKLKAHKCELCGKTDAEHYEIHHVHKVKDLKGKELWEQNMIAKRRKTIVVCRECHYKIHGRHEKK